MNDVSTFDLLTTVEQGGCSAKIPAGELSRLLAGISLPVDANVLVDTTTHDDAGVYRVSDEMALIVTTDFFPPLCSSASDFGEIAAANALSDIYAMGGKPLLALNLSMFPSAKIPLEVLRDILAAGQRKINESGAFTMGGHTIEDYPPKYGLAVVGTVHPDHVITNASAVEGDCLILTKPLGTGVIIAAHRLGMDTPEQYAQAIANMKQLNNFGAEVMQQHEIRAATDVTGFSLAGHLLKMVQASGVSAEVDASKVPLLPGVAGLIDEGCIPGAAFRNLDYVAFDTFFDPSLPLQLKMALCDAQTSGGLLICAPTRKAESIAAQLRERYPATSIIGRIMPRGQYSLNIK